MPSSRDGIVIWVTGLPESGKSTFARRLHSELLEIGRQSLVLDGDLVRAALAPSPGYGPRARDRFYETLARLAALLARQRLTVIVAATASRRAYRRKARGLAPRFLEVYLDVPLERCERRDRKRLYARARAGELSGLPGVDASFEPPERPDVIARGGRDGRAVREVVERLGETPRGNHLRWATHATRPALPPAQRLRGHAEAPRLGDRPSGA